MAIRESRTMGRCGGLRVSVVALIVGVLADAPAMAQPAAAPPTVSSLSLIGTEALDADRIRSVLATKGPSWLPWKPDPPFDPDALARDLQRIVTYYHDHGYPDARVIAHDVDVDERDHRVDITIRIEEGAPLLVAAIAFTGLGPLLSDDALEELRAGAPLSVGEPLVHEDLVATGQLAVHALQDRGCPYAEVRVEQEPLDDGRVRVVYRAEPGPRAYFGRIEIVGNTAVDDEIIRRELRYRPGDLFRRSRVQESQRQLHALELFQFVAIDAVTGGGQPAEVPTRVTVAEGKTQRTQFSVGYGTEEQLRGEIRWRHVNFLGDARSLRLRGQWSSLDRGGQAEVVQPYFLHPALTLSMEGHAWYTDERAFDEHSRGGRVSLTGRRGRRLTATGRFESEYQYSQVSDAALADPTLRDELIALGLDPTTGRQDGVLTTLGLEVTRDTTDNPLDPHEGTVAAATVQQAGGWLPGTYHFVNVVVEGRAYRAFGERTVLAGRLRAGTIDPFGPASNIPFSKRYFLGGSSSLRGWGRYEVSQLSETGLPIGGQSLIEASLELRMRAWGRLGAAAFVDAGQVSADPWRYRLGDLRYDAGLGVRYRSPVGLLRLDVAYQLTPIEGLVIEGEPQTRRWRIHFGIGQAF